MTNEHLDITWINPSINWCKCAHATYEAFNPVYIIILNQDEKLCGCHLTAMFYWLEAKSGAIFQAKVVLCKYADISLKNMDIQSEGFVIWTQVSLSKIYLLYQLVIALHLRCLFSYVFFLHILLSFIFSLQHLYIYSKSVYLPYQCTTSYLYYYCIASLVTKYASVCDNHTYMVYRFFSSSLNIMVW